MILYQGTAEVTNYSILQQPGADESLLDYIIHHSLTDINNTISNNVRSQTSVQTLRHSFILIINQ